MSRYEYDGDGAMPYGLWRSNVDRALKGKRGKQALRDLREALLALPEPRLIEGALCTVDPEQRASHSAGPQRDWRLAELREHGEGVCAIGAYLWHQKVKAGMDPAEAFGSLPTYADSDGADLHDTARLAEDTAPITYTLAWEIAIRNDETWGGKTPEERYTAFMAWIDGELGETAETTP